IADRLGARDERLVRRGLLLHEVADRRRVVGGPRIPHRHGEVEEIPRVRRRFRNVDAGRGEQLLGPDARRGRRPQSDLRRCSGRHDAGHGKREQHPGPPPSRGRSAHAPGQLQELMLTDQDSPTIFEPTLVPTVMVATSVQCAGPLKPHSTEPTPFDGSPSRITIAFDSFCAGAGPPPPPHDTWNELTEMTCSTPTDALTLPPGTGTITRIPFLAPFAANEPTEIGDDAGPHPVTPTDGA